MEQFRKLLSGLSVRQKVSICVAAVLVLACLYGFSTWRRDVDFKPLYTGVAAEDAGTIIQKIKESGVEYRLSDSGGVISVPSASVAELRLQLAAAGLPKSGRIGFELFDKTTFGSTEFVEHINYGRALEGELERSVSSLAAIEQARVHLTFSKDSVFTESREPAKASVVLKIRPGMSLSPSNVAAIQQLVASAVEGLNAEGVAVVDTLGGLLSRKKHSPQEDASSDAYAYQQRVEHDFAEKISATLDPMLGHEMYRASVSVVCDITSGEQNEETFDPTKSVMSSSQKTEDVTSGTAAAGGIPGSASNLPRPPARPGGAGATTSRRTENVAYESSHLIRKTVLPQGTIKRVSVAVLLDQRVQWEGKGRQAKATFLPPSASTVKAVHDIIAGVTGFTEERGDQIVVESVPFQSTVDQPAPLVAAPTGGGPVTKPADWRDWVHNPAVLIGAAVGAAIVLVLVVGVFLLRRKRPQSAKASVVVAKAIAGASGAPRLGGPTNAEKMQTALAERSAQQEAADMTALASFKLPAVTTRKSEILVKELRETAKKDATGPAQVLQTWISGDE
jgi:flagellar M-ring protein FliF